MSEALLQYHQTLARRQQLYDQLISTGKATPFLYPWDLLPPVYALTALVLGPRLPLKWNRLLNVLSFLAVASHSAYICSQRRTVGLASGYGIGIINIWGTIITGVLLLVHGGPRSYARLEWRDRDTKLANGNGHSHKPVHSQNTVSHEETELRRRQLNGNATKAVTSDAFKDISEPKDQKLVWQLFPSDNLYHSVEWSLDLLTSFRGPNWNYRLPTMPPITAPPLKDSSIKLTRSVNTDETKSLRGAISAIPSSAFDLKCILNTIKLYLMVDILKAIIITDPYFLGISPMSTPVQWTFIQRVHEATSIPLYVLSRISRVFLTPVTVITTLALIFSLCPLFFYTILPKIVDPKRLTYSPLTAQWQYPPFFHSMFPTVADKGLNGIWSKCWHQVFRIGFSEPSIPIIEYFRIKPTSQLGRIIQLLVAFGISGVIHAVASSTTFSIIPSKPYMPFAFFVLQAGGLTFQQMGSDFIIKTLRITPPQTVRRITNWTFVLVWSYYTGPVIGNDFARCGVWLFEPLPVSFVRPLMGGNFWMWQGLGDWVGFWSGVPGRNGLFDKGIAIF